LVEDHIGLADGIARSVLHKRNVPAHVEREEVVAIAREALVKACNSYDPSYGVPARSWISLRVWGAVVDSIRCVAPKTLHEHRHGLARTHRPDVVSLNAPAGDGETAVLEDVVPGEGLDPLARATHAEVRRTLRRLGKRQRRILFRSYFEGYSSEEIARLEGLSESRVQFLRRDALMKLRGMLGFPNGKEDESLSDLSEMELEVLRGTALGESAGETAGRLSRSIETVKDHRRRIIQKLEARNMYHALTIGFEAGLLEPRALSTTSPRRRP
jgi:RNA polymerase sigma factor (sigma-70 family)